MMKSKHGEGVWLSLKEETMGGRGCVWLDLARGKHGWRSLAEYH